ncbi:formate/nitrite transporter family protein [Mangrovivirga sp. M17]|uniref:Formate/nitrite transporter family protein n=1 Tax=Mangrovivirga halotolerans TaxID=2993936 RepID=A0ABT3RW07_9BACT|nr:formate/nitrite transporter family protein [Mangrovivirga halotolerans]MCX2745539.1 formate/nitrite transporter family protein [Mangrovivirga halotolerans]
MSENSQKNPDEIVKEQARVGFEIYELENWKLFLSALIAGLEIGFSLVLMGYLHTIFKEIYPDDILGLIVSFGYPIGFIFVIIGRSELFTEQTALAMIPVLNRSKGFISLLILWGLVLLGNLVGGLIFSYFFAWFGPAKGFVPVETLVELGEKFINEPIDIVMGSAILAGWMMGLLGWLITSVQESISRIILILFITIIIGMAGLHHCIVGSVEVLTAMWVSDSITVVDYWHFLWPSVLGNLIGGAIFVSVLKFGLTTNQISSTRKNINW